MPRYVSILRGINVGAHRRIKMADLKALFEKLGAENVRTYIQSGNVIFDHKKTEIIALNQEIEKAVGAHFDGEAFVATRTMEEVLDLLKADPFKGISEEEYPEKSRLVTFLCREPEGEWELPEAKTKPGDRWVGKRGLEVFSLVQSLADTVGGFPSTPLEKGKPPSPRVPTTTRYWKVIKEIMDTD